MEQVMLQKRSLPSGHEIAFVEKGSGEPLLLIPATGVDHTVWGDHLDFFARYFHVYAIDNLGTGGSSRPENLDEYTEQILAGDAYELMKSLGVEQAHVAGISMGSIVSQQLAIQHPEFVRSLSLYNTWGRTDAFMKQMFQIWKVLVQTQPMSFAGPSMLHWLLSEAFWQEHPEQIAFLSQAVFESPQAPPPFVTLAHLDIDIAHDTLDQLHRIQAPTLIIAGEEDRTTPLYHAREVAERIPDSQLKVIEGKGSSHLLMNERAEEFRNIALQFLQNVN
jgi:pimeloyl-ACP methyl ester carboxylesterase